MSGATTRTAAGKYRIALKRAWDDDTVAIVVSGLGLLARLALLVPPPRIHTTRYVGVWAPRWRLRRLVVPSCPHTLEASPNDQGAKDSDPCEHTHR